MKSISLLRILVVFCFIWGMGNKLSAQINFEKEMIFVEGAKCILPDNNSNKYSEKEVSSFYISKFEVSQGLWKSIMGNNPSFFLKCDDCPVDNVSWNDIQDFLRRLNVLTGLNYRLPESMEYQYLFNQIKNGNTIAIGSKNSEKKYQFNVNGPFKEHTSDKPAPSKYQRSPYNTFRLAANEYLEFSVANDIWMAENLNSDHFRNGDLILEARSDQEWKEALDNSQPAWCYYDNDLTTGKKYGKLYNWWAIKDPRGLAPAGFHIPSQIEWLNLLNYKGENAINNTTLFQEQTGGTRGSVTLFAGKTGGLRGENGDYFGINSFGSWWSSSEGECHEGSCIMNFYLTKERADYFEEKAFHNASLFGLSDWRVGHYIRCLRSTTADNLEKKVMQYSLDSLVKELTFMKLKSLKCEGDLNQVEQLFRQIEPEIVLVEGGSFIMGNRNGEIDEKPTREVQVRSFYMGKFEVTQAQWQAIMGKNPSGNNLCEDCPVENISWIEVQDFINRLNILTGENYRLPTEVEWEYAAKGGIKTRSSNYSGSDSLDLVAIYNGTNQTWKVGTKISNELGIYDMSGNVWEWCQDWYNKYSKSENSNIETNSNLVKVIRGGCWYSLANTCRPTSRSANYILSKSDAIGFRLVLPIN